MWKGSSRIINTINTLPEKILRYGDSLFIEGEKIRTINIIIAGSVKTVKTTVGGGEWINRFNFNGDWVGLSDYPNECYSVSAFALGTCSIRSLPVELFAKILAAEDSRKIILQLINNIYQQQVRHSQMRWMRAGERIALFLCEMSLHFKKLGYSPFSFLLPMTRADIANYLGMSAETLSRELSDLEKKGIIIVSKKEINIINMIKLHEIYHNVFAR